MDKVKSTKLGEVVELEVFDLAFGGKGVAKLDGMVVLVHNAVPGDVIKAKILKRKRSFAEAEVLEIIKESSKRTQPKCSHFGFCGGCLLQNLKYEYQTEYKTKQVNTMKRASSYSLYRSPAGQLAFSFIVIALITILGFSKGIKAAEKVIPFHTGERLTFEARWSFIPAGEVVLEVLTADTINGVKSYHFVMTSKTYPFIDLFYKVRDRIDAYTDKEMTHAILYRKKKQGRSKRNAVVNFDWDKLEAQYSNFGNRTKPISILHGSFDPLSVFYFFRLHDLRVGAEIKAPVTDGKKCVIGKVKVIRREKVRVACGMFDTYVAEPELEHIGGVFEKSKDAKLKIWVTADERRIPVKVESKVIVGSFVAELGMAEGIGEHVITSKQ